jgi:hypothetical protein
VISGFGTVGISLLPGRDCLGGTLGVTGRMSAMSVLLIANVASGKLAAKD